MSIEPRCLMLSWHLISFIECINQLMVYLEGLLECHDNVLLYSDERLLWEELESYGIRVVHSLNMHKIFLTHTSNIPSIEY